MVEKDTVENQFTHKPLLLKKLQFSSKSISNNTLEELVRNINKPIELLFKLAKFVHRKAYSKLFKALATIASKASQLAD